MGTVNPITSLGRDNAGSAFKTVYRNTYTSLSGVDITAVFAGVTIGNIQALSYSITREKAPIYTMGSPEPRGFARGKRGIAGSLVFIMFDRHVLLDVFRSLEGYTFVSDKDEIRPEVFAASGANTSLPRSTVGDLNPLNLQTLGLNQNQSSPALTAGLASNLEGAIDSGDDLTAGWERVVPWYADQIPPFNIVLTGVAEDGIAAQMAIYGVELLNEGYGVSIDDIVSEQQFTFVARAISPWTPIHNQKLRFAAGPNTIGNGLPPGVLIGTGVGVRGGV